MSPLDRAFIMKIMTLIKSPRLYLYLLALAFLSACASNQSSVAGKVTLCCATEEYKTFSVTTKDIPAFLEPLMVNSFGTAMAAKGWQTVSENAELNIELRYEQDNLSQVRESDDFDERISSGEALRFIGRIVIDVRDPRSENSSEKVIWSAYIQRIHNAGPGDYMHTGNAATTLLDSFNEVLVGFPK